eukprot:2311657-Lingulodinium_polyedra.AAC.1
MALGTRLLFVHWAARQGPFHYLCPPGLGPGEGAAHRGPLPLGQVASLSGTKALALPGVVLHQTAPARPVLEHVALHCLWQLGAPVLQRVAS